MTEGRIAWGAAVALALMSHTSEAQLHADVDLEGGAQQRFLTRRPPLGEDASLGPTFVLSGHIAVLPLLRAGAYVTHEISPIAATDTRQFTSAGLSLRILLPWPHGAFRMWLAAGLGYVSADAPSYYRTGSSGFGGMKRDIVEGAGGDFFEVPTGVGGSWRFVRNWELVVEAGARIGFAFIGSMYNPGPTALSSGAAPETLRPAGDDSLGVFVVAGMGFEP